MLILITCAINLFVCIMLCAWLFWYQILITLVLSWWLLINGLRRDALMSITTQPSYQHLRCCRGILALQIMHLHWSTLILCTQLHLIMLWCRNPNSRRWVTRKSLTIFKVSLDNTNNNKHTQIVTISHYWAPLWSINPIHISFVANYYLLILFDRISVRAQGSTSKRYHGFCL